MSSIVIAVIAAAASVTAAIVSGTYAVATRHLDTRLQRIDKAQDRISERKFEMYEPILDMLGHMFTLGDPPTAKEHQHRRRFNTWVTIYGSAATVRAYTRLMLAVDHEPPADIQFRLYADFLLAVRADIGDPDGTLDQIEILGPRLPNLSNPANLTDPDLSAVCERLSWQVPWPTATKASKRSEARHQAKAS